MHVLIFEGYTLFSKTLLGFLKCVDVGDFRVVYSQPAIDCRTSKYEHWFDAVVIFTIFIVIGLPITLASFLRVHRHLVDDTSFAKRWGVLFDACTPFHGQCC